MAVTIYDIAQKTGYSPPTVSKALNNQSDIAEATRLKIATVAQAMGYVPNQGAKALVTRKSWLIGMLFEEIDQNLGLDHPLFSGIMNAFKEQIEREGYELIFIATNLGRKRMSYLEHCRYRGVDGVLVLNSNAENDEVLEVASSGFPCVSANLVYQECITVTSENRDSSVEAVKYLHKLGHRRIAHIAGPQNLRASAGLERLEGYRQGLEVCGLPGDETLVFRAEHWTEDFGQLALQHFWSLSDRPTALFSSSDLFTVGVYSAARALGVRLPQDLSVVSFDDNAVARYLYPALTTFRQDRGALGREAARLILDQIAGRPTPRRIRVPVRLIERESCREYP